MFTSIKTKINLESLLKGVYLLKTQNEEGGLTTKRLIKNEQEWIKFLATNSQNLNS